MATLTREEKEETASVLEWYLDEETDKEQVKFFQKIIKKLRGEK